MDKKLVKKIRRALELSEKEFYVGPETIFDRIRNGGYKDKDRINLSFIKKTLKDSGLSKAHRKRIKGNSAYQHYPKTLIESLGEIIVEIDFLERVIEGRSKPLNFMAFSCKKLNLRHFRRISSQTSTCAQKEIKWFCDNFFIPDAFKMDNGLAFIGSASGKRSLSKIVVLLFKMKVLPIFTNPRSPWNNGSVEGSNSVFARNFWNKFIFSSIGDVDRKMDAFNKSSLERSTFNTQDLEQNERKEFIPKIYFIRKVRADQKGKKGIINILNDEICLPKGYINLFTLSEWNLKTERLTVLFEKDQSSKIIKIIKFRINNRSKKGRITFI